MRKLSKLSLVFFIFLFFNVSITSYAETTIENILEINLQSETDRSNEAEEVSSNLVINNLSERYDATELKIRTKLPEELTLVDADKLNIKDNTITWDIDNLKHSTSIDLSFITKSQESTNNASFGDKADNETNAPNEVGYDNNNDENEKDSATITDYEKEAGDNKSNNEDELVVPQTGDNSNSKLYIWVLAISIILGIIAIIGIRKKKAAKLSKLVLLFFIVSSINATDTYVIDADTTSQDYTFTSTITVDDKDYDIETTVTTTIKEGIDMVPVTGTVYNQDGELVHNSELHFETEIDDKKITQVAETNEDGYFVTRLFEDFDYKATAEEVESVIRAKETNKIDVENSVGEIELGKTLQNDSNHSHLQPSVIYLGDEELEEVTDVSKDLSKATVSDSLNLKEEDLIVVSELEEFPEGIAFKVESVEEEGSNTNIELDEPELEEVFEEIVGEVKVEMSENHFLPAEGVEVVNSSPELGTFSTRVNTSALNNWKNNEVELALSDMEGKDFGPFDAKVLLSGEMTGDIDWRAGINPINTFDFNFQGAQKIIGEFEIEKELDIPDVPLGRMIVPTQVPGLAVTVPFDLVSEAKGGVSTTFTAGMKQEIGFVYANNEEIRTYPEDNIAPIYEFTDLKGTGELSVGLRMSVLTQALGIDLAGAAATGSVNGEAETSIIGTNGLLSCGQLSSHFGADLNLRAPIANWESDSLGMEVPLGQLEFGECITSINTSQDNLEINLGETKSIELFADSNNSEARINNDPNLDIEVQNNEIVSAEKNENGVDLQVTEEAQDGEEVDITFIYHLNGKELKETVSVKVVDNRSTGELVGTVIDNNGDLPLEGVAIKLYKDNQIITSQKTDKNGKFNVEVLPGKYKVEMEHFDYVTEVSKFNIKSDSTLKHDTSLKRKENEKSHLDDEEAINLVSERLTNLKETYENYQYNELRDILAGDEDVYIDSRVFEPSELNEEEEKIVQSVKDLFEQHTTDNILDELARYYLYDYNINFHQNPLNNGEIGMDFQIEQQDKDSIRVSYYKLGKNGAPLDYLGSRLYLDFDKDNGRLLLSDYEYKNLEVEGSSEYYLEVEHIKEYYDRQGINYEILEQYDSSSEYSWHEDEYRDYDYVAVKVESSNSNERIFIYNQNIILNDLAEARGY